MTGRECPRCHERDMPFEGCLCDDGGEALPVPPHHICPCCGRAWLTESAMRAGTEHVGMMVFDDEVIELANCPCGSTRAVSVRQTRDDCPPTLRDPGLPPVARDGCAGAAGDANSRE